MNQTTALNPNNPIALHCDLNELVDEFEYYLNISDSVDLVDDELTPALAMYAAEYMLTRNSNIFMLIIVFCNGGLIQQRELVNVFRTVVDNNGSFVEPFHHYFNIDKHYVYLHNINGVAVVTLRDTVDESSVALISPDVDDDY